VRFWHEPVRAERLALTRILVGVSILTDLLFQYLPRLEDFFGPRGVAPQGLHDAFQLRQWYWTMIVFNIDDPAVLYPFFWGTVAVVAAWTIGLFTRVMNVAVWLIMLCWIGRNGNILNGGDDTMQVAVFLLLLSPSGRALSVDAWLRRCWGGPPGPVWTEPWPIRLFQIQLAVIYCTTGLAKLLAPPITGGPDDPIGTWWAGTSVHYVLNYVTMSRWSFAQLPLPFWLTAALTYSSVWWEVLFPVLVLFRGTRWLALWFGVMFHLGIWLTIEVGWFSFYTLALYGVWVPDWFWGRLDPKE
jgi:hypothetical protein